MMNFYKLGQQVGMHGLAYRLTALVGDLKMQLHTAFRRMNEYADKGNRQSNIMAYERAHAFMYTLEQIGVQMKIDVYWDVNGFRRLDDYCIDGEVVVVKQGGAL